MRLQTLLHIFGVSFYTLLSRITGLLRDILMFSAFGTSALSAAFLNGFTLTNLFRRLFGEGALTSVLIPTFSKEYHVEGKVAAFQFLNQVMSRLMRLLLALVVIGIALFLWGYFWPTTTDNWRLTLRFCAILLPYMFFICMAAVLSAILNVFGRFWLAACNSIWLNLSMIVALSVGFCFSPEVSIYILCGAVLIGGIIQMGSLWYALKPHDWCFHWDFSKSERIDAFWRILLPGLLGATIVQINTATSQALVYDVSASAVSILYLVNRLIELPLGLFVIAATTVIFPRLSQLEAQDAQDALKTEFENGISLILMILFPSVLGLISLSKAILTLLFRWGNFTTGDVAIAVPVLDVFALSLPFYALSIFLTRAYHSKRDMVRPMWYSTINFVVNLLLTLALRHSLEALGVAIANFLSIILQVALLRYGLRSYEAFCASIFSSPKAIRYLIASCVMGGCVAIVDHLLVEQMTNEKLWSLTSVAVNVPLGVILYFTLVYVLSPLKERQALLQLAKMFIKKFKYLSLRR
ncbi:MAG: murein biosynthesis integral membrane protein MurJ [Opitutales bacterium]|nr:murein biosynthesis integral membrane protein MurJ [Opitutales bacterium]